MPEPVVARSTRSPIVARNGFVSAWKISTASPAAGRPLDVDRRRLAEPHLDAVVRGERRLDDLLLHLPVERDRDLLASVVLADVDQGVLLGELRKRGAEPRSLRVVDRDDDGLQRRRRELVCRSSSRRVADHVAELDLR